jgi:hypothetical protein
MGHMIGSNIDDTVTSAVDARSPLAVNRDVGIGGFRSHGLSHRKDNSSSA